MNKPILFSTPMVQAILNGRKTETRRVMKSNTPEAAALMINLLCGVNPAQSKDELLLVHSPYEPGDMLWIRETWRAGAWDDEWSEIAFDYKASPEVKKTDYVYF